MEFSKVKTAFHKVPELNDKKKGPIPDFIGIGTAKAATKWIFQCLKEHPEICTTLKRETKFFNREYNYRKGIEFYLSLFKHCPKNKIKGEFTSDYLLVPKTAKLIHAYFPKIKIFACLRNPVEKVYSEYHYHHKMKWRLSIYPTFEEAIERESGLIKEGYYHKQIKPYFNLFPKENILVLFYEEISENPFEFVKNLYTFLGVQNPDFIPSCINHRINITGSVYGKNKIPFINAFLYRIIGRVKKNNRLRKFIKIFDRFDFLDKLLVLNVSSKKTRYKGTNPIYAPINEKTKVFLQNIYKEDIKKLERLIQKDLNFW